MVIVTHKQTTERQISIYMPLLLLCTVYSCPPHIFGLVCHCALTNRNIYSVHGFLELAVKKVYITEIHVMFISKF